MSDIIKKIEEMQEQLKELAEQIEEETIESNEESEEETDSLDDIFGDPLDDLFGDDNDFGSSTGGFGSSTGGFGSSTGGFCDTYNKNNNNILIASFKSKKNKDKQKEDTIEFDYIESRKYNCTSDCEHCQYEKGCEYSTKNIKKIKLNSKQYEQLEKFNNAVNDYWKDPFGSKYGKMKIVKEFAEFVRQYDNKEKTHKKVILALGTIVGLGLIKKLTDK